MQHFNTHEEDIVQGGPQTMSRNTETNNSMGHCIWSTLYHDTILMTCCRSIGDCADTAEVAEAAADTVHTSVTSSCH